MKTLNRRTFVKGVIATSLLTSIPINLSASTKISSRKETKEISGTEFNLSIEKTSVNITGNPSVATTVNGMLSGPTLRWKEGDTVTINVTNNLSEDTSIHWHGLILPPAMDGVPGISFDGIKPGKTFTYTFPIVQSGTYWYHSHSGFQEQSGVYGAIVIEPKEEKLTYDKEYVISLSDWSDEKPDNVYRKIKLSADYYNFKQRTVGDFFDEVKDLGFMGAFNQRKMWNEMAMTDRDLSDVTGYTYTYLMNGQNPATNFKALFKNGEKIRLRFINSSAMTFFDVCIPGLKMTVVAADGNYVQPVAVDEFRIGVAETYDVIVEPETNTSYAIFAQSLDRSGYALGALTYDQNIIASTPSLDPLPILSHSDMGMDMNNMDHSGHDMSSMKGSMSKDKPMDHSMMGQNMKKSEMPMDMKGMDHSKMGHDMSSMMQEESKPMDHSMMGGNIKKPEIPITKLEEARGVQTTMRAMDPQYRLDDPGVGLRNNGRRVLTYADLRSLTPTTHDRYPDREIILRLTGNMERYMWSINGIAYKDAKPLEFKYGERLRITYINDTMMNHPMHLHGMWSDLETGDDNYLPKKHTIIAQPGSKISFRVNVDAKGSWAYHCHLLYHMAGMFRKVVVA
ncbi:copper resistance system multicopper oxidase [Poseidonibacter ostreae]|jgi:CopA family copper-resistance protein|uniref:Copper resistance system multicopper oxidase n=1 Tax=Poseidonibacter ostreae TaxID=2654171 RepID=A0A6L4WVM8_9BACT|nr:copper resistance system multicopper oxidase [Poseidonibacter ostreae]KAB7883132.1 copper resistance system multicopper oxidase [Poseidonibacter ostreae]KAB7889014.1 copper resistance system multicopper oxidase [Poseidonibacter ostreae]KAB7891947.1 copper resistance system multicopper oxidase [Poseidonibacter ostreae]